MADSSFTQQLEQNVRRACSELRQRLRSGENFSAESIFAAYAEIATDPEAALEIVYTEYVTREELGQHPSLDDLLARFPQWQDRLRRLLDVHAGFASATPPPQAHADTLSVKGSKDTTPIDPLPEQIGAYEIYDLIGRGGMGVVYEARHASLKRRVALKRLLVGEWASAEEGKRFRTEAETISRLDHPNIVKLFEIGEHGGQAYLVLELVEGGSLADLLTRGPLPAALTVAVIESLARALQHAHDRGILHRDLKPGNILLQTPDGAWPFAKDDPFPTSVIAKIADFGLAKRLNATQALSESGKLVGTPAYMAPERLEGNNDDPASDIYSLGVVLYECLTGRPPFLSDSPLTTLAQVRDREPVSPLELQPDCPRDLAIICLQCLQKDPGRRYASAAELADDLQRFRQGEPIKARATGALERLVKWSKRRPAVASLLSLVICLTFFGGGVVTFLWLTTAHALGETENERQKTANALKEVEKQRRELVDALAGKNLALAHYQYAENKFDDARLSLNAVPDSHRDNSWARLKRHLYAQRASLQLHDRIHMFTFSPDGRYIGVVTPAAKENVQVWDHLGGRIVLSYTAQGVQGIYFRPDNKHIGILTYHAVDDPDKRKVDVTTIDFAGKVTGFHTAELTKDIYPQLNPQARKAVGIRNHLKGGSDLVIYNLDTGALQSIERKVRPSYGSISNDGARMGVFINPPPGGRQWEFEIVDLATEQVVQTYRGQSLPVTGFSPDWTCYHTIARVGKKDITNLTQIDLATGKANWTRPHSGQIYQSTVSLDGKFMCVAGVDKIAYVLDAKTGAEIMALRGHESPVAQMQIHSSNRWLATSDSQYNIRIWSLDP